MSTATQRVAWCMSAPPREAEVRLHSAEPMSSMDLLIAMDANGDYFLGSVSRQAARLAPAAAVRVTSGARTPPGVLAAVAALHRALQGAASRPMPEGMRKGADAPQACDRAVDAFHTLGRLREAIEASALARAAHGVETRSIPVSDACPVCGGLPDALVEHLAGCSECDFTGTRFGYEWAQAAADAAQAHATAMEESVDEGDAIRVEVVRSPAVHGASCASCLIGMREALSAIGRECTVATIDCDGDDCPLSLRDARQTLLERMERIRSAAEAALRAAVAPLV
jgi:hypothetical protein